MRDIDQVVKSYIVTALWSSIDNADDTGGEPLDENYGPEDLSDSAQQQIQKDCVDFVDYAAADLREAKLDDDAIGHNFWLNRNGHGAGFWDLGLGAVGERLNKAAHSFGSVDLYVGDDGKIHHG